MPANVPASLGYRMPAEWEPHRATWIAWPHNRHDWPGKFSPIPWIYVEIVRHLHRRERVRILAMDTARPKRMLARAGVDLGQVDFYPYPTDRVWTRDYGPMFIKNESQLAIIAGDSTPGPSTPTGVVTHASALA